MLHTKLTVKSAHLHSIDCKKVSRKWENNRNPSQREVRKVLNLNTHTKHTSILTLNMHGIWSSIVSGTARKKIKEGIKLWESWLKKKISS